MTDKLKPCPFCGGEPIEDKGLRDGHKDGDLDAWAYFVVCRSCAATGGWAKSARGARRQWNMRVDHTRHNAPVTSQEAPGALKG